MEPGSEEEVIYGWSTSAPEPDSETGEGLTASGGWCAQPSPLYDEFRFPLTMFDLPQIQVSRGAIEYTPAASGGVWTPPAPKISKRDRFLLMAQGVATTSKCKMKHGAIVVKHGHVLGSSPNVRKNDPMYVDHQHSAIHAEVAALKKAGWPQKATVYVARVNGHGEARLSKPCANCQTVLDRFKCRVEWTEG